MDKDSSIILSVLISRLTDFVYKGEDYTEKIIFLGLHLTNQDIAILFPSLSPSPPKKRAQYFEFWNT